MNQDSHKLIFRYRPDALNANCVQELVEQRED